MNRKNNLIKMNIRQSEEIIEIRELKSINSFSDIHKFYELLSNQTKVYFYYPVFSWSSNEIGLLQWMLGNLSLILSLSKLKKFWWNIYPKATYLLVGAFASDELVGLCFIFKSIKHNQKLIAKSFGIAVRDEFHDLGIGSLLLKYLIDVTCCSYDIDNIYLEVLEQNHIAREFYKSFNFKEIGIVHRTHGCDETYIQMCKDLSTK